MPPIVDKNKCTGCFTCVSRCPQDAFGIQPSGSKTAQVQYPRECVHCGACVLDCPVKAITLRFPIPWLMVSYDAPTVNKPNGSTEK